MEEVKIFIAGDFAPRMRVADIIEKGHYEFLYNDLLPIIQSADYSIVNLEAPIAKTPTPIKKTGPNLIAPTKSVKALKYVSFNMVTLANNHAMDQGKHGLESTINLLKENAIEYVGAGLSEKEIQEPRYLNIKGKTIAIINCCENEWSTTLAEGAGCNPLNEIAIYYQIEIAKKQSDYCILIIHGGHEMYELPSPRMVKLYRWFIDLGVNAVIGHHTHCFSGHEIYKGCPIVYSLGNFIFDNMPSTQSIWFKGCAAILHFYDTDMTIELVPFNQCGKEVGVHLLSDEGNYLFFEHANKLKSIIEDQSRLEAEFSKFVQSVGSKYNTYLEPSQNRYILAALKRGWLPSMIKGNQRRLLLNLIRCESHRDIVNQILSID
ncbi:MAG: CapA family protein [Bacteroidales bacterium]|nr:CapA family protein [Bacteroidales bacterium]